MNDIKGTEEEEALQVREGDNCHFDITFANFHETPSEERDNLTGLRLRKAGKFRQQFN